MREIRCGYCLGLVAVVFSSWVIVQPEVWCSQDCYLAAADQALDEVQL